MQILNPQSVLDYMARVRASGRARRYPFGQSGLGYSQNDPNAFPTDLNYSDRIVFGTTIPLASLPNSGALQDLNDQIAQTQQPGSSTGQNTPAGLLSFNVLPFLAGAASQQVLAANPKRGALLMQNQSTTLTLWFNLGQFAGVNQGIQLGPGLGLLFDQKVPMNYVTVIASGGTAPGIAVEGM